jgi:hypothetical protein
MPRKKATQTNDAEQTNDEQTELTTTGRASAGTVAEQPPREQPPLEQPQPQQRRRRRRRTIDTAAEASLLIAALLRQRGTGGANQDELQQVVVWGRSVRAENQELQRGQKAPAGTGRGRRRRPSEEAMARAQRSELNTLLLERVLLGTLGLDVQNGQLVFLRQELEGQPEAGGRRLR